MVHGDDFLAVGTRSKLEALQRDIERQYECKHSLIGPYSDLGREIKVIGRWIRYVPGGIEVEVDPNMLMKRPAHTT